MVLRPVHSSVAQIFGGVIGILEATLRARSRKNPRQVRVSQVEHITALAAMSTRWRVGYAEQCLRHPETEPLLAYASRSVEQEALRQCACDDPWEQARSKLFVAVQLYDWHVWKLRVQRVGVH
jgi:hypothetical protein